MKNVIQIALAIIILVLGYVLYESIQKPIRFNKVKDYRYDLTIENLKEIRTCQVAYKSMHGKYTGSFDTLIDFVKNGKFKVVMQIGSYDDSAAVARGEVRRDTVEVPVLDSLFKNDYNIDQLKLVPTTKESFELGATVLEVGAVKVPVFEAKAHNNVILHGLNEELVYNLSAKQEMNSKFPGVMVGSLAEANNNAGNWE